VKFTKEKPKLKSKFFNLNKEDLKKVSVDVEIIPKEKVFYLNVKKSGIYSVEIYDLLGKKKICFKIVYFLQTFIGWILSLKVMV